MVYRKEFRQWEHKVAREFHRRLPHLSLWDFGDFMTRDMFDDGYTVEEAVDEITDTIEEEQGIKVGG